MFATKINQNNQNGVLLQPGQGTSYWVLGDLYTFKTVSKDTNGTYSLMEMIVYPQTGTPLHIHSREDESSFVQSGEIQFQLEGQTFVATPGSFIYSPKGQRHLFANKSDQPATVLCWVTPAGLEQFFMEIGTPADDPTSPPPPVTDADIQMGELSGLDALRYAFSDFQQWNSVLLRDAPGVIREAGVEALLVDQVIPVRETLAEFLDMPWIEVCNALIINPDDTIPPFFTTWSYNPAWWARLRNLAAYLLFSRIAGPIEKVNEQYRRQWKLPRTLVATSDFPHWRLSVNSLLSLNSRAKHCPITSISRDRTMTQPSGYPSISPMKS